MQSEQLRRVHIGQTADVLEVLRQGAARRHAVLLVEGEVGPHQPLGEPHVGEGDQEALVEVVGDATAVLNLAEHVADGGPRDALEIAYNSGVVADGGPRDALEIA